MGDRKTVQGSNKNKGELKNRKVSNQPHRNHVNTLAKVNKRERDDYEDFDFSVLKNLAGKKQNTANHKNTGKTGNQTSVAVKSKDAGKDKRKETGRDKINRMDRFSKSKSTDRFSKDKSTDRKYKTDQKMVHPKSKNRKATQTGCPHIKECGSCRMMQQSYEKHIEEKQKLVQSLIAKYCKVEPIIGMKEPKHYRNKVHAVFDHDRKGNPISGIYEEGSHRVIPIDSCMIHNQKADEIIVSIRSLLKSFKIKTYDEDTGYGLLRHVLVRSGLISGEIMVVLVLSSPIMPSKNNFVKALRKLHPEITTIIVNVNDKKTSMVLGEKEQVIYGKGYIEDQLCGKVFRISPKSFYQVNPVQAQVIYEKAIELAGLNGTETIMDAYCGTGTIGIIASDYAKRVIGVELNKDAVQDAVNNARRNQVSNIDFYHKDAGEFLSQLASMNEALDLVILDPPRAGSDEKFLNSLIQLKPNKVVYISCNPITLERDMQYLVKKGYKAEKAIPVDMFPWTEHVESVVLITRVKD